MREKILLLLNESDDYISGEEISNKLGVSRTAIWKVIKSLKEQGYEIESVTRKGYKLLSSPDILEEEEIHYNLKTSLIGKKIITYDQVDSTNKEAKKLALQGTEEGTVIVADEQLNGKGRRGRNWVSPKRTGIWMSMLLRPDIRPENASMITLVAGLAVCKAIETTTDIKPLIKWPNDIVINGKKICGILTEMSSEIDYINFVVVGIGINVNTKKFPEELDSIATSLKLQGNKAYKRQDILKKILEEFEICYNKYLETEDLQEIIDEYNSYCVNISREVIVKSKDISITGTVKCVTPKGELIVTDSTGKDTLITSGEVSVRGIYGYV